MKAKELLLTVTLIGTLVGLTYAAGPVQRPDRGPGNGTALTPLTDVEIEHVIYMREEEKMARDVYLAMAELYDCPIFVNIGASEQRHMDALGRLITRHGLTDSVTDDTPGVFTNLDLQALYLQCVSDGGASLEAALKVGKLIEELDISDLKAALSQTVAVDVTRVFANLLRGSSNHLAAFNRAIESGCTSVCDGQGRGRNGKGNGGGQGNGQSSRQRMRDASCDPIL
jgi:hypothetical protein